MTVNVELTKSTFFQITTNMVKASTTLAEEDVGLWCFLVKGRYHGFLKTKSEAYLAMQSLIK